MLKESIYMLRRRLKGDKAIHKYAGNAEFICHQIVDMCFNGIFFQVSQGHFNNFYIRDFGMCIKALIKLGYKEEVYRTLTYAMSNYSDYNKITTTITPKIPINEEMEKLKEVDYHDIAFSRNEDNECKDFFSIAPDSLAFLLYSLRIAKQNKIVGLIEAYKPFLEREIKRYYDTIVIKSGEKRGLVKKGYFSSMKDHAIRNSSCYDNCMLAMISKEADKLKLKNPFKRFNYKKLILKHFWNDKKKYFKDDLNNNMPTGDANVFPFWCEIFEVKGKNKKNMGMLKQAIKAIQKNKLDKPFPLKYSNKTQSRYGNFLFFPSLFARNYESNSIWMHLGLCYLDVVSKVDKKLLRKYLSSYKKQIEKHHNFLEVYDEKGKPYKSMFYLCDDSMIWASKYLELSK
jgi:hypothetical protein